MLISIYLSICTHTYISTYSINYLMHPHTYTHIYNQITGYIDTPLTKSYKRFNVFQTKDAQIFGLISLFNLCAQDFVISNK